MNRRQFFAAVARATAVAKIPSAPAVALDMAQDSGVGISIIHHFDQAAGASRFDVLYGMAPINPELACLVVGGADDQDGFEEGTVVEDEPEAYVSPRVAAADRLLDLAGVIA